jgi:signal-transduction protein with cAMP-binding, CBS, and nucleotidyltransferase domain
MDLNSFFDALEELSLRLYKGKDLFENLSDLITKIADQMWNRAVQFKYTYTLWEKYEFVLILIYCLKTIS